MASYHHLSFYFKSNGVDWLKILKNEVWYGGIIMMFIVIKYLSLSLKSQRFLLRLLVGSLGRGHQLKSCAI